MHPISSQVFWRPDFENHWLRESRQTVIEMGSQRVQLESETAVQVQAGGWGGVGMGALVGRSHSGHAISAALFLGGPENSGKEHWAEHP